MLPQKELHKKKHKFEVINCAPIQKAMPKIVCFAIWKKKGMKTALHQAFEQIELRELSCSLNIKQQGFYEIIFGVAWGYSISTYIHIHQRYLNVFLSKILTINAIFYKLIIYRSLSL